MFIKIELQIIMLLHNIIRLYHGWVMRSEVIHNLFTSNTVTNNQVSCASVVRTYLSTETIITVVLFDSQFKLN